MGLVITQLLKRARLSNHIANSTANALMEIMRALQFSTFQFPYTYKH
jgi:hypothetical protein